MLELEISTPTKENCPLLKNVNVPSKRAQWFSPCKSSPRKPLSPESDVPSLKLNHFSKIPKISFGNVKVGDSKTESFIVFNPHATSQTLTLEKCLLNKGFSVERSEHSSVGDSGKLSVIVPPNEEVFLSIKWEPTENGSYRELIRFMWDNCHRLQVVVFGKAIGPQKVRRPKCGVKYDHEVGKKTTAPVLQPTQVPNNCKHSAFLESLDSRRYVIFGSGELPNKENQAEEDLRRETFVVKRDFLPQINKKSVPGTAIRKPAKRSSTPTIITKAKKSTSGQRRNKFSPTSGTIQRKPKLKVKLKTVVKGVPQRKLQLVKTPKSSLPRHPMPFAAKNMYYDERWMHKQQEGFTRWLNFVLTPAEEPIKATQDSRKGTIAIREANEVKKCQPLAPTKEVLSLRVYTARRKMARLRQSACLLYQSEPLIYIIRRVEAEVEYGRLAIRPDKKLHADLGIKQQLIDILLSYNTLWLRIGLETIYGEILPIYSNNDVAGLTRFINDRLLGNPDIAKMFAHPQVPGLYREGYEDQLGKFTLKKFLLLVLFLDRAKLTRLVDHDPCLFNKDAVFKSSRSLLLSFSREYLKGEGDVTKHLNFLGYAVTHSQKAIDEVDYAVKNLATDLRDGLRLTRVVELLTRDWQLSARLRVPAISRLQKIHNVEVFMDALKARNILLEGENGMLIDARHIVDGHREKTLALLWQIIFHFQVNVLLSKKQLQDEVTHLENTTHLRAQLKASQRWIEEDDLKTSRRRDSTDLYFKSDLLRLLLKWCKIVCRLYGSKIENFTVSFSDGRALCYLLHHYHPTLLPLSMIKERTTLTCNPGVHDESDSEGESTDNWSLWTASVSPGSGNNALLEELKTNERENFCLLGKKVQELGGVPLMTKTADMSTTIPDEKVVITYVAYLCARLLDLREETKAARCIQMAWRRHWFLQQMKRRENIRNVVVFIQARTRGALARRRFLALKQAAVLIQSVYRGHLTRIQLQIRHRAAACIQSRYHAYKQGRRVWEWFNNLKRTAVRLQRLVRRNHSERLKRRDRAAVLVQATWRGHHARQLFNEQRAACVKLQSFFRGAVELKRFRRLKQATFMIQRWYRALLGARILRKRFLHTRRSVVKVQSLFRGKRDRQIARRMRAAIKLQSHARTWLTRRRFLHLKQATIKIQAHVRKRQAEVRYATLKRTAKLLQVRVRAQLHGRKQRLEYQKMKHASVKIQSLVRGYMARNELMRRRNAAVVIQTAVRKYLQQKRLVSSIVLIQARFREYLHTKIAKQTFLRMKCSAVKIQSLYRGYKCRERMKRVKRAVITIQSHVRRHLSRKKFLAIRCAALLIQVRYRAFLQGRHQRNDYQRLLLGVTRLQAVARGNAVRKQLRNQREAATVIKAWVRRYVAVKRFHCLKKSAVVIQRHYRRVSAIRRAALRRASATRIQASYRGHRARMFFEVLKAVVVLQSAARGWKVRKNLERQHKMALFIQAVYRAHVARQRYRSFRHAVVLVQRRYRALRQGRDVRSSFKRMRNAAVKIQSYVRFCQSRKQLKRHQCATKIQAAYRGHVARKSFRTFCALVVRCQAIARGYLVRKHLAALKSVAILLQTRFRARVIGMRQYLNYHVQRGACIVLQAAVRSFICMKRYQVIRNAAIVIQQRYRAKVIGRSQRKSFLEKKAAVIRLQACARGWRARKTARKLKAARLIEATYKMHKTRQEYLTYRRAVITIQAQSRMVRQRRRFEELKKATTVLQRRRRARALCKRDQMMFHLTRGAVITLQMAVKGYLVRARLRKMNIAAVRIQAHVRGLLERKRYAVTKKAVLVLQRRCRAWFLGREQAENYRSLKSSAVVIQSCYRSYRLRYLRKRHKAAVTIQAAFRRHTCRATFLARKTSVVIIQAAVKGYLARQSYLKLRCATVFIQQRLRAQKTMQTARQRYVMERNACIAIQSCVRGWLCRQRYITLKTAAVSIQRYHRACVEARKQRRYFWNLQSAALCLQSYFRMHLASTSYKRTKDAITKIQAASRMRTVRERYRSLKVLTIALQRRYRANQLCKRQQAHYQRTRMSLIVVQAHYRGFKARQMVKRMVKERERRQAAAIKIQRYYLSCRLMKEVYFAYHVTRGAIITIQSAHRMRAAQKFVRKVRATVKIQAFYRGTVARRNYLRLRQAVCKLQSMVRRKQARRRFKRIREAVVVLQQKYRAQRMMKKTREDFNCLKQATVVVQSQFRRHRQRQSYLAMRMKIVQVQAMVRMRLQRTTFLRERSAAIAIQRCYRSYIADKVIRERSIQRRRAAVKLQACFRRFQARRKATNIKSAILIQSTFRRFVKRRAYLHTRRVVVNMQALTRRRRCFKQYHSLKNACVGLQRRIRANNVARNARQNFILLRRAVVRIQSCYRGWKTRSGLRQVYAARRIQRWYRAVLQRRRARRKYLKTLKATLVVQAAYRGYRGRLIAREMRAARIIQAALRGFITRRNIKRQNAARHAQLMRFTAAVHHHLCAVRIQRYFRRGRAMALAKARMECVLFIQFWWRGALQRHRFIKLRRAAVVIQREARKKLENKHSNAASIQALIRGVLVRRRLSKMQASALRIQANWRGYLVRRKTTTVKVERARRRIESANAAACESMKLRNRTRSALDFLLRCRNISRILEALVNLEVVTRLSWVCCEQVVGDGALRIIFKVIKKCNRSLPHMEIIKYSISILLNVARCPYLNRAVYDEPHSVDILVELLTNFRDKAAVFSTTCRLLVVFCWDSAISEDLLNRTKAVDNIRTVHSLAERKYKLETKRTVFKSRTERSVCPRPNATPCKHTPYKAKTSNWMQWKEPVDVVDNPLEAVRSLVRCLELRKATTGE